MRRTRRQYKSTLNKISLTFTSIACLITLYIIYMIFNTGLLPSFYRIVFGGIASIILATCFYFSFNSTQNKLADNLINFLSIIYMMIISIIAFAIHQGIGAITSINQHDTTQTSAFSLIVQKDSPYNSIDDVKTKKVLAPIKQDEKAIDGYIKELRDKKDIDFVFDNCNSYIKGADELLKDSHKILLLNESYRSIIADQFPDFEENTKVLDTIETVSQVQTIQNDVAKGDSFNIYLSGIDTYGQLTNVSRSDVNLVVTVNPTKHKILITTIPRDSYLPIAGGGNMQNDKLTHAGIYGIDSSIGTLENLLDTNINYYARVNFSTLVDIVDILGGINIYNDQAFTTDEGTFPQGELHLDGEQTLRFSRERYSLSSGDLDRGRNHMKVLEAMIHKATSPAILTNYTDVLTVLLNSAQTNVPKAKIIELINGQLSTNARWNIESQDISGHGEMGLPSYAMPGYDLYMFVVDESSVNHAKQEIQNTLNN